MHDSVIKQILLHLYDSIEYGTSYRFKKGLYIDDLFYSSRKWGDYKREDIKKGFKTLKREEFILQKEQYDGSVIISLSEKGKLRALNLRFWRLANKKENWDGKWRMVAFDIPDSHRKGRDALRYRLQKAGFRELQESMFIYPHDCEKEIKDFVLLFRLEKYVTFALLDYIDRQENLIKSFRLKGLVKDEVG